MKTIVGPFHPDLEDALVNDVLQRKRGDLLAPLLILVPSDLIRRRLKILLTREKRLALLNIHLLTFFQLSRRLNDESGGPQAEPRGDLFLEEALRQIVRTRQPGAEPYAGIENRAGGCAALWQTLRDLRDGMVDPAVALEALREGHFRERASERLAELLALCQTFQRFCREKQLVAQADLDRRATEQVASSSFLSTFTQVYYYGFYDLTQIQLDLFHRVAQQYPTTLLFPLIGARPAHNAWSFAASFYERYVQGHSSEASQRPLEPLPAIARLFDESPERDYAPLPATWHGAISSAFGLRDEVAGAAKEILRLNEQQKMPFHEIGVVARNLDGYGRTVTEVFREHCVPVAGRCETPLVENPLAKAVNLLLSLPSKDFLRSQVIDFLSSPHLQFQSILKRGIKPRPELWDLATRELAICKGAGEWRRLRRYKRGLMLSQISDDDEPRYLPIRAAQLTTLADIVDTLIADLSRLPQQDSWNELSKAWQILLEKYFGIVDSPDTRPADGTPQAAISAILHQLAALDAIDNQVSLADFSHTFGHWIERTKVIDDQRNRDGVMVLSATEARGLSFRALFVLGMNESVFPRAIREDAFLRDGDRDVIERDLGYKVNPKLTAFDEEKLLFALLAGAARERFYCSYQRADENGRVLAPSWYVGELQRALGAAGRNVTVADTPRSTVEKSSFAPFDRDDLWLPRELAVRLTLEGSDPTSLIEAAAPLPEIYRHGRSTIAELEHSQAQLLSFDGMLPDVAAHWQRLSTRGSAPTALETYARCPFRFYAHYLLGLEPLERPEEISGPSPLERGELGHAILDQFYRELIARGYFTGQRSAIDIETILPAIAQQEFAGYEQIKPVGYPLAWENLKDDMLQTLRDVVAQDLAELARSGFAPVNLETKVSGQMPADWLAPLNGLAIRGRMDRIDRNGSRLRVIDYKFKFGGKPKPDENNLVQAALRGQRLQPPIYLLLAQHWAQTQGMGPDTEIEADFYYIAPHWPKGPLDPRNYDGAALTGKIGAATQATIAQLAEGVRGGRFFINPDEHCSYCEVTAICRKNHPPSVWRAENDPITEAHRELQKKSVRQL